MELIENKEGEKRMWDKERRPTRAMPWHLHVHVLAAFVGVVVVL